MAISSEFNGTSRTPTRRPLRRSNRRGTAFLLEALIVLAFLMGSFAVFVRLFASAQLEAVDARRLSEAVLAATNRAEEFSADPHDDSETLVGEMRVTCDVTGEQRGSGVLWHATIRVTDERDDEEIYSLETARYVSGEEVDDR